MFIEKRNYFRNNIQYKKFVKLEYRGDKTGCYNAGFFFIFFFFFFINTFVRREDSTLLPIFSFKVEENAEFSSVI